MKNKKLILNPYPNEHSARLRDPSDFDKESFKRTNGGTIYGKTKVPSTIAIIWGKLTGKAKPSDNPIPQALRFPIKNWTETEAEAWLKKNNIKYKKFEKASGKADEKEKDETKYRCECLKCHHVMTTDKHCREIKCEKCGGEMRRAERKGLGQSLDEIPICETDDDGMPIYETIDDNNNIIDDNNNAPEEIDEGQKSGVEIVDTFFAPCIIESKKEDDSDVIYLTGMFAQADKKNGNDRIYPRAVLEKAITNLKRKKIIGTDGHPSIFSGGSYRDVALKFLDAWMDGDKAMTRAKILKTQAGRELEIIANESIQIGLSMRGFGEEKFDEKKKVSVIQDNFILKGIDAVLEPAFEKARVIKEQLEKQGGIEMTDEEKKQIEEMQKSIDELKLLIESNKVDADLIAQYKAEVEAKEKIVEAKKHVAELMDSDEYKEHAFKDVIRSHLEKCESVEDVDRALPRVLETIKTMHAVSPEPQPESQVIVQASHKFFGETIPETPEKVMEALLDKFENKGIMEGLDAMDNPRWIAERLIRNYINASLVGFNVKALERGIPSQDIYIRSRRNPLYNLTKKGMKEALGDDVAYTGDIQPTTAFILPLYTFTMKDMMDTIGQLVSIQPLDRPSGKAFFGKSYYGDGAGAWTEIKPANFDKTKGDTAEAGTPQMVKFKIEENDIALGSAKKFIAPFTIELEQDLKAYFGMNIDSVHVQIMRKEIMREISYSILNSMLTDTSFSKSDAKITADSNLIYSLTPPANWSETEWLKFGLTKIIKQADASIDNYPADVSPDWIIAPKTYKYLFTEPHFVADEGVNPTGFGLRKVGTYQNEYKVFFSSSPDLAEKILLGYRGTSFLDAGEIFLPYILFYLGQRIPTTTLEASRTAMFRGTWKKAVGQKFMIIDIQP